MNLGITHQGTPLHLSDADRRSHVYITGKSGSGKTTLLEAMILDDIHAGRGLCYIDPHGDSAERLIDRIPKHRVKDTIYLDPTADRTVGFNPLHRVDPLYRATSAALTVELFRNKWTDSWGPRMDYIMQNAIHLLLETHGTTLVDLHTLLVDEAFRFKLLDKCQNQDIIDFWIEEFGTESKKDKKELIRPILNKTGKFQFNPILRDIISHNTIDMAAVMNEGKILICNLSKHIGSEPAGLLGAFVANKIAQTAQERRSVPEEDRRDFTLYIDEFQNFTTESFAAIFSEARKYRLSLVAANQFLSQIPENIRAAALGNVGTRISFRVGPDDAEVIAKDLDINPRALMDLHPHTAWASLPYQPTTQFSTYPPTAPLGSRKAVLNLTRSRYSRPRP